jgi:hypothetical protein
MRFKRASFHVGRLPFTRSGGTLRMARATRVDHSLKFSNAADRAGVRKLLARDNSVSREHKTFDALNFLCA